MDKNLKTLLDIPEHIKQKALDIEQWFNKQGVEHWELYGICSRKSFVDTKDLFEVSLGLLEKTSKIIGKQSGESLDEAAVRVIYESNSSNVRKSSHW